MNKQRNKTKKMVVHFVFLYLHKRSANKNMENSYIDPKIIWIFVI
jgi:hypothetical protein